MSLLDDLRNAFESDIQHSAESEDPDSAPADDLPADPEPEPAQPESPAAGPETSPVEPPVQQTNQTAPTGSLFDAFKSRGLDFTNKYTSEESLIDGLSHLVRKFGERNELAQLGQFVLQYPQQAAQWLNEQLGNKQPAQQPTKPAAEQPWLAPDEWDESWLEHVTRDEQGNLVPKPGAPPDIVAKIVKAENKMRKFYAQLARDPASVLQPIIQQATEPLLQRALQAEQRVAELEASMVQAEEQATIQDIIHANAHWMFKGGTVSADNWTPAGRRYAELLLQEAKRTPGETAAAIADRAKKLLMAEILERNMASVIRNQQAAPPPPAPSPPPPMQRGVVTHRPNQAAKPAENAAKTAGRRSLFEKLLDAANQVPEGFVDWS